MQTQPNTDLVLSSEDTTCDLTLVPFAEDLPRSAIEHRMEFRQYVLNEASAWHRKHLARMYDLWDQWNVEFFSSLMKPPYILLAEPSIPQALGDCAVISGFGGNSQIRIRPSLITGSHPKVRGWSEDARLRMVEDILLHEMLHQWQQEVTGNCDSAYSGHGPTFRDKANEIGAALGLGRVRTCKLRGADKDLPSCSYWPQNVRPTGFYPNPVAEELTEEQMHAADEALREGERRREILDAYDQSGHQEQADLWFLMIHYTEASDDERSHLWALLRDQLQSRPL
jgi:hypothetical protein